jgi:hypothetical protein
MPYRSKAQAAYLHIHHPEIAKRWDSEMGKAQRPIKALPKYARHVQKASAGRKKKPR